MDIYIAFLGLRFIKHLSFGTSPYWRGGLAMMWLAVDKEAGAVEARKCLAARAVSTQIGAPTRATTSCSRTRPFRVKSEVIRFVILV